MMEEMFGGGDGDPLDGGFDEDDPKVDMIQSEFVNVPDQGEGQDEGEDDTTSSTTTTTYVTLVMFEQVRKQLEETHQDEVSSLKRAFDFHMEERRENEKLLKTCIETLMSEVVRLEERIEEIDKKVKAKVPLPPPPKVPKVQPGKQNQNQKPPPQQRWEEPDIKIGGGGGSDPQPQDLLQVKMEDVEGAGNFEQHLSYPTDPLVDADGATSAPAAPQQLQPLGFLPEDPDPDDLYMIEGEEGTQEDPAPETTHHHPGGVEGGALHGKADGVGNFLPFLCHCGLEFDSEAFLSDHIQEEEQEQQMNQEVGDGDEEEANFDPALLHHTDWATPQIQQIQFDNVISINPTSTATPPKPRIRKRGGPHRQDVHHGYDPYRPMSCLCRRVFPTKRKLYRHVQYFTKEKDCSCMLCGKVFAYASHLKAHVEKSHNLVFNGPGGPGSVPPTKAGSGTYPELKKALAPKTKNVGGTNRIVIKATTSGYRVSQPPPQLYPIQHHGPPRPQIAKSQRTPGTKPWQHKYKGKSHGYHPYYPLHCLCGLQSRDRSTLSKHVNYFTELKSKAMPCKVCGQKYPYASQLNAHMSRAHGRKAPISSNGHEQEANAAGPSSSLSVRPAGRISAPGQHPRFPNQHGVGRESTDEEGKPQYFCKCGRSYVSKGVLNFHIRMATSGKLLHCHLCPEGSRQYSLVALKYHMKTKHNLD